MNVTFKINLLILEYNINNNRTKTMISLLEDEKIQKYAILTFKNHVKILSFSRFII